MKEMKTKQYFESLIELWIKWAGMADKKYKKFIDVVPIILCQNPSWIIGLRIYGEGRIQILLGSLATIGPLAMIQDRPGLY